MWVFDPYIASLCSAEVEAYFIYFTLHIFNLAYTSIIVYSTMYTVILLILAVIKLYLYYHRKERKWEKNNETNRNNTMQG